MIVLPFTGVSPNQLNKWLTNIPPQWKKVRGWSNIGTGFELISTQVRQFDHHQLVVTEWEFKGMTGAPRPALVFLFNTLEDSCEVFVNAPKFYMGNKKLAMMLELALEAGKKPVY